MNATRFFRFSGASAFISGILTILGFVTLITFFVLGQPWGTANDLVSAALALSLMPVVFALYRLAQKNTPVLAVATLIASSLALLIALTFQLLLVARILDFEQTAVVVPAAFGVFGAALVIYTWLGRVPSRSPRGLALLGVVAGVGYLLVIAGIILGGQQHPLTAIAGLAAVLCYPLWAMRFSRLLRSDSRFT